MEWGDGGGGVRRIEAKELDQGEEGVIPLEGNPSVEPGDPGPAQTRMPHPWVPACPHAQAPTEPPPAVSGGPWQDTAGIWPRLQRDQLPAAGAAPRARCGSSRPAAADPGQGA
jgi:hypothetical protein